MNSLRALLIALSISLSFVHDSTRAASEECSASGWSSLRAAYRAARQAFEERSDGSHVARNLGQRWNAEFDGRGFVVRPDHGQWTWGVDLRTVGTESMENRAEVSVEGNKLSYQWSADCEEWFLNDERGLEQGWTIGSGPNDGTPLVLTLAIRGSLVPRIGADRRELVFEDGGGSLALTYGGLMAWDANGDELPVRFAEDADERVVQVLVDTDRAVFPVTIDPLVQQAYLKASNTDEGDHFGRAVAISGDTVVVGAPREDSPTTAVNGAQGNAPDPSPGAEPNDFDAGAAYVFVRAGADWIQQAYLKASNAGEDDRFGASVAISADTIVVGAWGEDSAATAVSGNGDDNSALGAGAAYVFVRSGARWTQEAYLKASNAEAGDNFGVSVAVSGNMVVVGATSESSIATGVGGDSSDNSATRAGAAYVFSREGTTWSQEAYLKPSNSQAYDMFGFSVAVAGETVVIGAPYEDSDATEVGGAQGDAPAVTFAQLLPQTHIFDSGAAYVFVRDGGSWSQQAYLKGSNAGALDTFGRSVTISGDRVAVGAPWHPGSEISLGVPPIDPEEYDITGSAYVFARSGTSWSEEAFLRAPVPEEGALFGCAVGISGNFLVVGELWESSSATDTEGDPANDDLAASGAAHLFSRHDVQGWLPRSYIKASNAGVHDRFGRSVAVSGATIVVGAGDEDGSASGVNQNGNDDSAVDAGAAYVFYAFPDFDSEGPGPELILEKPKTIYWTPEFPFLFMGPLLENETLVEPFEIRNGTASLLTGLAVRVEGPDAEAFRITSSPVGTLRGGEVMTFSLEFSPSSGRAHSATLVVTGLEEDGSAFTKSLALSATVLSRVADSDRDGMNDGAEFLLRDLGFDWEVTQPALVETYYAHSGAAGLISIEQMNGLKGPGAVVSRDPVTGKFVVTMDWQHSTDLQDYFDFPLSASDVSVTREGDIQFSFDSAEEAMFFKVEVE